MLENDGEDFCQYDLLFFVFVAYDHTQEVCLLQPTALVMGEVFGS